MFEEHLFLPANPDVVLVDTGIVRRAPARLLIAGMGDALATYFEARACARSCGTNCVDGKTGPMVQGLAPFRYGTPLVDGVQAALAARELPEIHSLQAVTQRKSGLRYPDPTGAGKHQ